jgi:hypothetical protein
MQGVQLHKIAKYGENSYKYQTKIQKNITYSSIQLLIASLTPMQLLLPSAAEWSRNSAAACTAAAAAKRRCTRFDCCAGRSFGRRTHG